MGGPADYPVPISVAQYFNLVEIELVCWDGIDRHAVHHRKIRPPVFKKTNQVIDVAKLEAASGENHR